MQKLQHNCSSFLYEFRLSWTIAKFTQSHLTLCILKMERENHSVDCGAVYFSSMLMAYFTNLIFLNKFYTLSHSLKKNILGNALIFESCHQLTLESFGLSDSLHHRKQHISNWPCQWVLKIQKMSTPSLT